MADSISVRFSNIKYLVRIDGRYAHTHFTPAQTRHVQHLLAAGVARDAVAAQTGIAYSSLGYVAALEHCSRVLHGEDILRQLKQADSLERPSVPGGGSDAY